jgi:hypothetical protein
MAALVEGTDYVIKPVSPNSGIVQKIVRCIETVDATNTIAITLKNKGIGPAGFIGLIGFVETTSKSVYAQEIDTTSVSAGVLTVTIPAGTDNDRRFLVLYGEGVNP